MPRLDARSPEVANHYPEIAEPFDVCVDCFNELWLGADRLAHKPYEKMDYGKRLRCVDCDRPLIEIDN